MHTALIILHAFWQTLGEMAPWLLFGFAAAGVLSVWVKKSTVEKHLGGPGPGPVVKAAVFGVPLPLCSCGVLPFAGSMYRQGASRGATSSFLLSTPQTGVDSFFATYALMGPVFAVVRPAVAFVHGILGGLAVNAVAGARPVETTTAPAAAACCGPQVNADADACCGFAPAPAAPSRTKEAARFAFVTLPGDLAGPLLVGVALAALLMALVPPDALTPYLGGGLLAMLAAIAVGAPLYLCATASIPVALGLVAAGASPGVALAFLIAGPATNAATLAVTWKLMGARAGLTYLISVVIVAVGAGLALDAAFTLDTLRLPIAALHAHDHASPWWHHVAAAVLLGLLIWPLLTRWFKPRSTDESDNPKAIHEDAKGRRREEDLRTA